MQRPGKLSLPCSSLLQQKLLLSFRSVGRMDQAMLVLLVQVQVLVDATSKGIEIHSIPLVPVLKSAKEGVAAAMDSSTDGTAGVAVIED